MLATPQNFKAPKIMLLFSLEAGSMYDMKPRQGPGKVDVWIVDRLDTGQQVEPLRTAPHKGNGEGGEPLNRHFILRSAKSPAMCPNLILLSTPCSWDLNMLLSLRTSLASSSLGLNATQYS